MRFGTTSDVLAERVSRYCKSRCEEVSLVPSMVHSNGAGCLQPFGDSLTSRTPGPKSSQGKQPPASSHKSAPNVHKLAHDSCR